MATLQDVRDFTAWHGDTLFHLRNTIIPAIRRGAIDDAQACLARRTVARRPNVSLGAMAEANSNELLGTHPLDIDGMTAHAVVGQLAERLMIELREAEHARELKVDLQTQRDELQELCRQLDEFDWDDLERRLPRESTRMIGRMESENDVRTSELPAAPAKVKRVRKHNRKPANGPSKPLTPKQAEALRLYGEFNGNMSAVARQMGVKAPTAQQHYDAANKKLGITVSERAKTMRLAADQLGHGVKGLPAQRRGKGVKVDD